MMRRRPQKGFTLVETLVAIAIISIIIGAPFYAAVRSINAAENARDELTANMLAQEGIEYVVNIRNDNYVANYTAVVNGGTSNQGWLTGLNGTGGQNCFTPNKCTVSPETQAGPGAGSIALSACQNGNCGPLYVDPTTGFYTQQSGGSFTKTRFTRYVQLTTVTNNEAKVVCTVTWSTNHVSYTTSATEYIDNWLAPS